MEAGRKIPTQSTGEETRGTTHLHQLRVPLINRRAKVICTCKRRHRPCSARELLAAAFTPKVSFGNSLVAAASLARGIVAVVIACTGTINK